MTTSFCPEIADYGLTSNNAPDRIHPRLTTRSAWIDHSGELPIIEGALIRLQVDRLPGGNDPLPVWLWSSATGLTRLTGLTGEDVDVRWQAFLRRFDLARTFRMIKQTLGWTRPKLRTPEAGDRWTWLVIAAHTQLRLTREAAADLRRPWEKRAEPARPTPARVRRGFWNLRPTPALSGPCTEALNSRPSRTTWLEESPPHDPP